MKIGLAGLPNTGKTTIFNALTRQEAPVSSYANPKAEPNIAVIDVDDERITRLTDMYTPKKTTRATIELVDFVGFTAGAAKNGGLPPSFISELKTMDAVALVARNFTSEEGHAQDPAANVETLITEFLLSDLIVTENRLQRIEETYRRGKRTTDLEREEAILRRIEAMLNADRPVSDCTFSPEEKKVIAGFQFVTQKPLLVIVNSGEEDFRKGNAVKRLSEQYRTVEFAGTFEMELSRLDDEEKALFMADMGIDESARARLTRAAYDLLGCISFLTVGTDEVRAWTIREGDTALDAAAVIHSDLARGFIRAECFTYTDLLELNSEKAVKDAGRFRLEGKDYTVSDGDILNIRFSV